MAPRQKFKALRRLIETQDVDNALIFCNRKREVASLRRQMERVGLNVRDIHGDLDQAQRTAALDAFKRGEIAFLVATDVAARGLDIARLPCVINYDVPIHADDYVHRIGRTGRAGQEGRAFTLVLPEERRFVDAITRLTGKQIPRLEIGGMEQPTWPTSSQGRRRRGRTRRTPAAPAAPRRGQTARAEAAPCEARREAGRRADAETSRPGQAGRRGRSRRRAARRDARTPPAPPAVEAAGRRQPVARPRPRGRRRRHGRRAPRRPAPQRGPRRGARRQRPAGASAWATTCRCSCAGRCRRSQRCRSAAED